MRSDRHSRAAAWSAVLGALPVPVFAQEGAPPPSQMGVSTEILYVLSRAGAEVSDLSARLAMAYHDADLLRGITLLLILAMTVAGSEILYWCYAAPVLNAADATASGQRGRPPSPGLQRLFLKLLGIGIGAASVPCVMLLLAWPEPVPAIATALVAALAAWRAVAALADFVLAPRRAAQRLWPGTDGEARILKRRVVGTAGAIATGFAASSILRDAFGAPALAELAEAIAAFAVAAILLVTIAAWSRMRRRAVRTRRSLADILPFGTAVLTIASLALWLAGEKQIAETIAILAGLVAADLAAGVILRIALRQSEDGTTLPDARSVAAFEPVIRRVVRFCLALLALIALLAVWRINILMQAATDGPLALVLRQSINVAVVILLCDLAWAAAKTVINRQLMATPAGEGEAASRLSTLLPMIRTTILIVLIGLVVLVTLSAMGVNIAPLLAGAGVVGLAIGFGAQTLVRDVITGVFFLIEDAFRVGEYIDVGTRKGTVEAISLRSLRLRHQRGALHTVPFGEIKSLSNESRDWSIVKLEFRIPFETDLKLVKRIIKAINAEIMADPELGPNLIEPIKSQGINRFEEYWMVLRVKYTAKPNSHQFIIRREAYQRIRDAFDKAGIRMGERSVKVEVAGQGAAAAAGAAAQESGERQAQPGTDARLA
jgi:moderate conductance mechanosensitive channel